MVSFLNLELKDSIRHKATYEPLYNRYLTDINQQITEKERQKTAEKEKTADFIRNLIAADKVAVEQARSKSIKEKQRQRDFQNMVWEESQAAIKSKALKRESENSKEREFNKLTEKELDRNIRERSQQRRVKLADHRCLRKR